MDLSEFITIALVHLFAVASPGPDFAIIVRQSLVHGKRTAIWSSFGVGFGILIHTAYSLLGIGLIISQSVMAFTIMKLLGGLYLIYIGFKSLRARPMAGGVLDDKEQVAAPTRRRAFWTGLLTNGLNPKATLFFLSLFTVIIKPETPRSVQAFYGLYMAVATAAWFCGVSLFFGHRKIRQNFQRLGHWLERVTGALLIGLGLRLAVSSQN
ncbi:MAG: LysE family transporter [Thermodesulfobacteriota bacterium]